MLSGFLSCFSIEQIPYFHIVGQDLHAPAVDMDVRKLIAVGLGLARVGMNMNEKTIEEEGQERDGNAEGIFDNNVRVTHVYSEMVNLPHVFQLASADPRGLLSMNTIYVNQ